MFRLDGSCEMNFDGHHAMVHKIREVNIIEPKPVDVTYMKCDKIYESLFGHIDIKPIGIYNKLKGDLLSNHTNENNVIVRYQKTFFVFSHMLSFRDFYNQVHPLYKQFHEVVLPNRPQKIRFDIDCPSDKVQKSVFEALISDIVTTTNDIFEKDYDIPVTCHKWIVTTSINYDDIKKYSCHLILDNGYTLANHHESKCFHLKVINALPAKYKELVAARYIDPAIYNKISSLRIYGSIKDGEPNRPKIGAFHKYTLENTLICHYGGICSKPTVLPELYASSMPAENDNTQKVDNKCIDEILKKYTDFKIRYQHGDIIYFDRLQPSHCEFCNVTHNKDNTLYAVIKNALIRVGCLRYNAAAKNDNIPRKWDIFGEQNKSDDAKHKYDPAKIINQVKAGIRYDIQNDDCKSTIVKQQCDYLRLPNIDSAVDIINCNISDVSKIDIADKPVIMVRSCMGSGKTIWLHEYLSKLDKETMVVIVAFRISFASDILTKMFDLGFVCYNDSKLQQQQTINLATYKRLIIQYESLHKIHYKTGKLVCILDESESILGQVSSNLGKNPSVCFQKFQALINDCDKLIAMDANLGQRTYDVIGHVRSAKEMLYINNTYKIGYPDSHNCVIGDKKTEYLYQNRNALTKRLEYDIEQNRNIFVVWTASIKRLEAYRSRLISMYPHLKIAMYTQEHGDKSELSNVNASWVNYNIVIISPTISAGISFTQNHFHVCYANLSTNSCNYLDAIQMIGRVRILKDNVINTFISHQAASGLSIQIDELEQVILRLDGKDSLHDMISSYIQYSRGEARIVRRDLRYVCELYNILMKNWSHDYYSRCYVAHRLDAGIMLEADNNIYNDHDSQERSRMLGQLLDCKTHDDLVNITKAIDIDQVEHDKMVANASLTADEKASVAKYRIVRQYNIEPDIVGPLFLRKYGGPTSRYNHRHSNDIDYKKPILQQIIDNTKIPAGDGKADNSMYQLDKNDIYRSIEYMTRKNSSFARKVIAADIYNKLTGSDEYANDIRISHDIFHERIKILIAQLANNSKAIQQLFIHKRIKSITNNMTTKAALGRINSILDIIGLRISCADKNCANYTVSLTIPVTESDGSVMFGFDDGLTEIFRANAKIYNDN